MPEVHGSTQTAEHCGVGGEDFLFQIFTESGGGEIHQTDSAL